MSHDAETSTSGNETKSRGRAVLMDVVVCIAATILVIGASVLMWAGGGGSWFENSYLKILGWVGVLVSLAGVLLAYLIFRRQSRNAATESSRQNQVLADLRALMSRVDAKVTDLVMQQANDAVPDTDAEDGAAVDDQWVDVTPDTSEREQVFMKSPTGRQRRLYSPTEVPLAVIGALVSQWRVQGLKGKWPLGSLRGAFRATGKGNHPWFLVLVPPRENERPVLWKVTRGPGGTDHATQLSVPNDLQ